jgi:hypothetical protein
MLAQNGFLCYSTGVAVEMTWGARLGLLIGVSSCLLAGTFCHDEISCVENSLIQISWHACTDMLAGMGPVSQFILLHIKPLPNF